MKHQFIYFRCFDKYIMNRMINFNKITLSNGLTVITHERPQSNVALVNIIYKVGSKYESENKTGIAHLFEHLMFGGSKNIKSYDHLIESSGGINNAYTTSDITSYYAIVPNNNVEVALWAESDRMLAPNLDEQTLEVQKKVVLEEFKEVYLNKPYGNVWPEICKLAYKKYPYKWPTIGSELSHIESINKEDIKKFFNDFYTPSNAILIIAGGIETNNVQQIAEKWFGKIKNKPLPKMNLQNETHQKKRREVFISGKGPLNAIYKAYHIPSIQNIKSYYIAELISNILGENESSILYNKLVVEKQYMSTLNTATIDTHDYSLLMIEGKINDNYSIETIDKQIELELEKLEITEDMLAKAKNQMLMYMAMEKLELSNIAYTIATSYITNNLPLINEQQNIILSITLDQVKKFLVKYLTKSNSCNVFYKKL